MVVGDVTTAVDVLILGAGPGGYVAAIRAAQLGRNVTLVTDGEAGGTCLNLGCIPLKALLSASERYVQAGGNDLLGMGISSEHVTFDWHKMQAWKQSVVERLSSGVTRLLNTHHVERVHGTGWFINEQEVRVEGEHGSLRFKFDFCVIATGGSPRSIESLPCDADNILTPEQALVLHELPTNLAIAGDDYIALELATLFARLGVNVHLYSPGSHILKGGDPIALRLVQASMRKQGITIGTNSTINEIQERPLIISAGVVPRVTGLHLNDAGLTLNPSSGGIAVDSSQRTSQANIFAVGDCTGGTHSLASYAIKQGKVAAEGIAGRRIQFAPQAIPQVIHTTPEIAFIGITDADSASEPVQTISGRFPLAANGRALTLGAENGVTRLLADEEGVLLGATLVGPRAGDLIGQLALAQEMGATLTDLDEILYPHPTLGETILEAAEQAQGKAIHTANQPQK